MDTNSSFNKLAQDVLFLQTNVAKVSMLVERFDVTIDKLTEVSTSLSRLLAVHENKLATQDDVVKNVSELLEVRRVEAEDNIRTLHSRISSGEKELKASLDHQYDDIIDELKEMRVESTRQHEALNNRITVLEKWMWVAIGGFTVLNIFAGNVDFTSFLG